MARLRDVFNRDVALSYRVDNPMTRSKFYQSGAFTTDERLTTLLNSGSMTFTVPHIAPLDTNLEGNYGNTIFTDIAMPRSIDGYKTQGRAAFINEGFQESRLARYLSGNAPSANQLIAGQLDNYWVSQMDIRAIATVTGIRNSDKTDKKLTIDISKATATDASRFGVDAFLDVEGTLDESMQGNGVMVVHPLIATSLRKQRLIERVTTSDNLPPVERYNGRTVIVSNRGTKSGDGANAKFVTYLLSNAAFAAAYQRGYDDMEVERTASTGNGAGHDTLWTRAATLIHPQGFSFTATEAQLTGGTENEALSPSWADLQNGDYWRLDGEAEQVGIRFLITNV